MHIHKGWFDDTLRSYSIPSHDVLFVNCDADLYSSTKTILSYIETYLKPGSFLYFDEFSSYNDELRAFDQFLTDSDLKFSCIGADAGFTHVLFRCVS